MVGDLLRRFMVSLVLSLPLFISHLGALFGFHLSPPFGLSPGLFGFCWQRRLCGGEGIRSSRPGGVRCVAAK